MRIFLDANILFSAARSDGAIRKMIRDLHRAGHELVADEYYGRIVSGVAIHSPRSLAETLLENPGSGSRSTVCSPMPSRIGGDHLGRGLGN